MEFTFGKAAEPLRVAPAKGYIVSGKSQKRHIYLHFTWMDFARNKCLMSFKNYIVNIADLI